MRLVLLAVATLAAVGCTSDPAESPILEAQTEAEEEAWLDGTLALLADGITQATLPTAVADLADWADRLRATGDGDLVTLAGDLDLLQRQLAADSPEAEAIGTTLIRIGQATAAASPAEPDLADALLRLGRLLEQAGRELGGRETAVPAPSVPGE